MMQGDKKLGDLDTSLERPGSVLSGLLRSEFQSRYPPANPLHALLGGTLTEGMNEAKQRPEALW